jgi:hypothetical protein
MTKRRNVRWITAALTVLLQLASSSARSQTAPTADIAVVVHPSTPVNELTFAEVRQVLLGERQFWTPQMPVVVLVRAPIARERDVVLRVIYQMNEAQFKQYWIAKIFRAEIISAPKIVFSNDTANELVSVIPGAIALIHAPDVRPGLKVLRVDGRLPGEPGYRLR